MGWAVLFVRVWGRGALVIIIKEAKGDGEIDEIEPFIDRFTNPSPSLHARARLHTRAFGPSIPLTLGVPVTASANGRETRKIDRSSDEIEIQAG